MKSLADYTKQNAKYITFVENPYYPDSLDTAIPIYTPVLERFGDMLKTSRDSVDLLKSIMNGPAKVRVQLLRVFRKYVSPDTSVEMLKKKCDTDKIIIDFGHKFRNLKQVQKMFFARPLQDEAIIAVLDESRTRGQKGYALTQAFFDWFEANFAGAFNIIGPKGAGADVNLFKLLPGYPKDRRPVDFIITEEGKKEPLVIGLARYDSDRGGSQEDDRPGGYRDLVTELLKYSDARRLRLKILFINDGPGLLLGSMWKDYCEVEESGKGRVMVATLKMLDERVTAEWICS